MTHTGIRTRAGHSGTAFDPLAALDDLLSDVGLSSAAAGGRISFAAQDPIVPPAHRLAACIGVPIMANAVAAVAFHRHRGGPVQDLELDLRHGPDVEVAAPVAQPIPGGMQAGQHQRAIWPQHPAQLAQGGHPVIGVFDRSAHKARSTL